MHSNKFGIAGAAMLGTVALLGTNAANAVIGVDADGGVTGPVTYAQETLLKQTEDKLEGYHTLIEPSATDTAFNVVVGGLSYAAADDFNITVTLHNMKFAAPAVAGTSLVTLGDGGGDEDPLTIRKHMGGVGDDTLLISVSSSDTNGASDPNDADGEVLTIMLPNLAISGDSGSIMVRLVNASTEAAFGAGTGTVEKMYSGAIKVVKALDEMYKAGPVVIAAVAEDFRLFSPALEYASLGTLELGVKAAQKADGTGAATLGELIKVLDDIGEARNEASSSVMFSGDFSFAEALWLEEQDDADGNTNQRPDNCSLKPTRVIS